MDRPRPAGITVSREARDDLAGLAAIAGGLAERRVTMSEALRAAVRVARAHPDEIRTALEEQS